MLLILNSRLLPTNSSHASLMGLQPAEWRAEGKEKGRCCRCTVYSGPCLQHVSSKVGGTEGLLFLFEDLQSVRMLWLHIIKMYQNKQNSQSFVDPYSAVSKGLRDLAPDVKEKTQLYLPPFSFPSTDTDV